VIQTAIARRYARALFDLQEPAGIGPTAETLRVLADAFAASREFRALLLSPVFTREQKTAVVTSLAARAECPPITIRLLTHVVNNNRIGLIREIREAFAELADRATNRTAVEVTSARTLAERDLTLIRSRLEQATRSAIDLAVRVDPGAIGGLEIRIGSTIYDGTIRGQLGRLRATLAGA
jgi:F-type H+-transporting ATPase subunit delta